MKPYLVWSCPKPAEVVSQVEGQVKAQWVYTEAAIRFWFAMWGVKS